MENMQQVPDRFLARFPMLVKNFGHRFYTCKFSSKSRMILLSTIQLYFHDCSHLHVSLAFGLVVRVQTKLSLAISLFILLSVNQALSTAFPYFVVVVNHNFAIVFFFYARSKTKGLGRLNQTPFSYIFLNSLFLKKCKSILMFWIPQASNNRASIFELIKNFLSSKTTLNG